MGQKKKSFKDQKKIDKETKEMINNVCLHNVSNSFICNAQTYYDEDENETYCKECGRCV
jgi:hypothetical protein